MPGRVFPAMLTRTTDVPRVSDLSGPAAQGLTASKSASRRTIAALLIVAAGACIVAGLLILALTPTDITSRDYIQYWAAGKQLARHANPYDVQDLFQLERHAGMLTVQPLASLSPPVALEFALPLGFLSARSGLVLWEEAQLAALALSAWLPWRLFGRPDSAIHWVVFIFAPAIACQMAGQLAAFLLVCLVLFFWFQHRRPWLAGAVLMPFVLKPHLFIPFVLTLIVFCVTRKQYRLLAGAAAAIAGSCTVSLFIDPAAWRQYHALASSTRVLDAFVPTLGMALRFLVFRPAKWIEFIPAVAGCAWAPWYFWNRRFRWDWVEHGSVVVMVSVLCAPYAFVFDQTLFFPAILFALYKAQKSIPLLLLLGITQAGLFVQLQMIQSLSSASYLWAGPAWLICYLCSCRFASQSSRARSTPSSPMPSSY